MAEDVGFLERAEAPGTTVYEAAPMPGYLLPGIADERVATGLAGVVGTAAVFLVAYGAAGLLRRKRAAAR